MSSILRTCSETEELGGGRYRHTQHLRPIAYARNGAMRRMTWTLGDSGDPNMPLGVDEAMLVKFDPRIAGKSPLFEVRAPDRSKMARFALLGANNVAAQKVSANEYVYPNALNGADLAMVYGGHKIAADLRLRAGHPSVVSWRMQEQVGFDPARMMLGDMRITQPVLVPTDGAALDVASVPLVWAVSQEAGRYRLDCALPAGNWAGWTLDPQLVLQPAAAAGTDNWLRDTSPITNYGTNDTIAVGNTRGVTNDTRRTLIRFTLTSIPAGATVTAATLSLWLGYLGSDFASVNTTLSAYRVLRNWVEAESTWTIYSTGNNWGTAGCANTTTDREAAAIGTHGMLLTDGVDSQHDIALTPGAGGVQDWVSGALANYGLLLKSGTEADDMYVFRSSDYVADATKRPMLVVDYTVPGGLRVFAPAAFANPFVNPFV